VEREASEVALAVEALYGRRELATEGVVHVSAVTRAEDGLLHVLKIGPKSPKSATDFFVLNLCRARCDAILTTAANLRAEPDLMHTLQGPWATHLGRYRESLGKSTPPTCVILTGSGDVPAEHPVWDDGTPKVVLTTESAASALRWLVGDRAEVVPVRALDARRACEVLRERGHGLISVEAGPTTARGLYEPPSAVDELLLSICDDSALHPELIGEALPDDARMFRGRLRTSEQTRREESGSWRFQRWIRTDAPPSLAPPSPLGTLRPQFGGRGGL